jgi:HAMP domain-containing protein
MVARSRELRARGDRDRAARLLETDGQAAASRVITSLERLTDLTQVALNESQLQASAALGRVRSDVTQLRARTWGAVVVALVVAVLAALGGTGLIAVRMTRSLRRLAGATASLAEGSFQPVPVESADEIGALARSFNSMATRLQEADRLKEQFYAAMSHELAATSARRRPTSSTGRPGPLTEQNTSPSSTTAPIASSAW